MAGERTLPGLNLTAFWNLGDDTWKDGMDTNIRSLSALVQPYVLSIQATEPGSPVDGEIYLSSGTWGLGSANDIMVRDNAAWVPITPAEGWEVFNRATDEKLRFDGTNWVSAAPAAAGISVIEDGAADRVVSNSDLAGNVVVERALNTAQTVTVNSGLTGTEPVTIIVTGTGQLTFAAGVGVTINSAGGILTVSTQYTAVTLIPTGSDVYHLIGAVDAA